jgi:DnaK suppressor protein
MATRTLTLRERRELRQAVNEEIALLDDQIGALTRRFDDIVEAAALTNTDDEHDPEGATIAFERAQVSSLLRQARADREALRATLERLEDPGYGTCELCAGFIGVERLMALPATRRCVRCAG